MFSHAHTIGTMALLLPALGLVASRPSLAGAGAEVVKFKRSDAICIQNYPGFEGYVYCQYYMVIDNTKLVDGEWVDNVKVMAKHEIWRGGTFLPDDDDPDPFDDYQFDGDLVDKETITASYNDNAHMVISETDIGLSVDGNLTTCKITTKVTHTGDGTVIFIHNKGENCPEEISTQVLEIIVSEGEGVSESVAPVSEEQQAVLLGQSGQYPSVETENTGAGAEVIRLDKAEAICYEVDGGFVFCDYGVAVDNTQTTESGEEITNDRTLGKREVYFGGTFDEVTEEYNYDGEFIGKYNFRWMDDDRSEVYLETHISVLPDGSIAWCSIRDKESNGEWQYTKVRCAHGTMLDLDAIIDGLTQEYEAAYLSGASESELKPVEQALTLLMQARDSAISEMD